MVDFEGVLLFIERMDLLSVRRLALLQAVLAVGMRGTGGILMVFLE